MFAFCAELHTCPLASHAHHITQISFFGGTSPHAFALAGCAGWCGGCSTHFHKTPHTGQLPVCCPTPHATPHAFALGRAPGTSPELCDRRALVPHRCWARAPGARASPAHACAACASAFTSARAVMRCRCASATLPTSTSHRLSSWTAHSLGHRSPILHPPPAKPSFICQSKSGTLLSTSRPLSNHIGYLAARGRKGGAASPGRAPPSAGGGGYQCARRRS